MVHVAGYKGNLPKSRAVFAHVSIATLGVRNQARNTAHGYRGTFLWPRARGSLPGKLDTETKCTAELTVPRQLNPLLVG